MVDPTAGNQPKGMSMNEEFVDLRTEREKMWDEQNQRTAERFKFLMTQPKATPRRVMMYIAKEEGITMLSVRSRLVKAGAYVIKHKNGNGRTESEQ